MPFILYVILYIDNESFFPEAVHVEHDIKSVYPCNALCKHINVGQMHKKHMFHITTKQLFCSPYLQTHYSISSYKALQSGVTYQNENFHNNNNRLDFVWDTFDTVNAEGAERAT